MIDLSYLTELEQEMIRSVLKRDSDLKNAEEQRVRNLQKKVCDKSKLKYLTGEWFYETKSRRHRDKIHGSDIIRASMSRRKPVTILELSHMWAERPSFVNSMNQDVYVPPELSGLLEEIPAHSKEYYRECSNSLPKDSQDLLKSVLPSSTKQRENPFNNTEFEPATLEDTDSQLQNGGMPLAKTPDIEFRPPSEFPIAHLTNLKSVSLKNVQSAHLPVPQKRTFIQKSQESLVESPAIKPASSPSPRSIIKHSPSFNSDDFPQVRPVCSRQPEPHSFQTLLSPSRVLEPSSDTLLARERECLGWIDRKQVRFDPAVGKSGLDCSTEMQDGKELGEHSLLDLDLTSHPVGEKMDLLDTSDTYGYTVQGDDGLQMKDSTALAAVGSPCWLQQSTYNKQKQKDPDEPELCQSLKPQVSHLHSAEQESGKPVLLGAGTHGPPFTKRKEDDGQSVSKVRDLFSWDLGRNEKPQAPLHQLSSEEPGRPVNIVPDEIQSDVAYEKPHHRVSPKSWKGLLGIFRRGEARQEKRTEDQRPVEEELISSERIELVDPLLNRVSSQSTVNIYSDQQKDLHKHATGQSAKHEEILDGRGLEKEIDQTPKETEGSADGQAMLPDKLSDLKLFWDREGGSKILPNKLSTDPMLCEVSNEETCDLKMQDFGKEFVKAKAVEALPSPDIMHDLDTSAMTKYGDISNDKNDTALLITYTASQKVETSKQCNRDLGTTLSCEEKSSSSLKSNDMLKLSGVDFSLSVDVAVFSQAVRSEEKGSIPLPVLPSSCSVIQQGDIPVSLVQLSFSPQEDRKSKINNLKSFWEKENTGPRVIVCKSQKTVDSQTQAETSPVHREATTCQADLRKTENDLDSTKRCSNMSLMSNCSVWDVDYLNEQNPVKFETESTLSQKSPVCPELPKCKDIIDDELKKTSYPKDLPRDSSSFEGARRDRSPFKTFPIDVVSPTRENENVPERSTLVVRQGELSCEVMQAGLKTSKQTIGITSTPPLFKPEENNQDCLNVPCIGSAQSSLTSTMSSQSPTRLILVRRSSLGHQNIQEDSHHQFTGSNQGDPQLGRSTKAGQQAVNRVSDERKLSGASKDTEMYPCLARAFLPQTKQYYLGLPDRKNIQKCISERADNEHLSPMAHNPFLLKMRSSKGSPSWISPRSVENVVGGAARRSMPEIWSQSPRASSSCHDEKSSLRVELKQISSRPISRSMENILSPPKGDGGIKTDQKDSINLTVNDVSTITPSSFLSVPGQMRMMSKSVSALQNEKDGTESDSTSVNSLSFGWKKQMGNSLTNLSVSSGMASMSSVNGSMASIYSGLEKDVHVKGNIQFAINYVQKLEEFQIFVVHCKDLAVAEPKKNRSDPYVKCYLLPDKAKMGKRKTSVKKKTLNPTYNEILRFKVPMDTLKTQTLNVSVWHNDNFGRNSFLGKVDLDLTEWDFSNTQINDYTLKERVATPSYSPSHCQSIAHRGQMKIALRFLPQVSYSKRSPKTETGEVQIWVKDCRNLPTFRDAVINPFVKCTVLPETRRKSRQKTRVVKKTANPMFNHTMVYDGFRPDDLEEICVEVTVWDHDQLSNHFLGGLRLGLGTGKSYGSEVDWMDSTSEESSLWGRMMQSHSEWVEEVLSLRMLIMAKGLSK
ncbi:hypothetical protein UPYG_G00124090 [Umbra pygmaea]|uniref:Synaptotagmin-like protein 2 n=1 Tax=Umbra pygmaea TaxID=75934 RepID=A0ABD0XT41_UMBPY